MITTYMVFTPDSFFGEFDANSLPEEFPPEAYLLVNQTYWYFEKDHVGRNINRSELPEAIKALLLLMNL